MKYKVLTEESLAGADGLIDLDVPEFMYAVTRAEGYVQAVVIMAMFDDEGDARDYAIKQRETNRTVRLFKAVLR